MDDPYWIDWLPLPILFVLSVVFSLGAIYLGSILRRLARVGDSESSAPAVGATLGLLAFVLAFTFSMASNRYDQRKQLLLEEVNAISTAYLRTDLIPHSYRMRARMLLSRYVGVRVDLIDQPHILADKLVESDELQERLWALVKRMGDEGSLGPAQRLFVESLNDMFDLQTERLVVAVQTRIPSTIWLGLYLIAGLAMVSVGYQAGSMKRHGTYISVILAMAFSVVLTLIADLDQAVSGTVGLNQQPMRDLEQRLRTPD